MPNPFSDALTSSLISPHSLTQMQTLLDSLDTQSNSESKAKAKSELLSFYLQSTLQSFLSPTLRLHHLTKPRLPLVRNIHTRTGTWCLVKDDWVLLNDDAHASAHAGAQAHAHQTPIHLRLVCILDLIRTGTATDFSTIDIDQRFLSIFRDITLAHAKVSAACNWFHGDISPMNVHVDRQGKGVLTDWDMRERNRTGA